MTAGEYLLSLPRFAEHGAAAYRPGLERMDQLMQRMGRPHEAFPSVHVAGTNGKGSVASLIASVGTALGRRVGLHTSPHLFQLTERMRIDGMPASESWLEDAVSRWRDLFDEVGPSFFEVTVALSFLYFAEERVDVAVVEVGMGGRLDATNILRPRLAAITEIGLDHTEFLGTTLAAIAGEKAGIIKEGTPVVAAPGPDEVRKVLRKAALERGAPLHFTSEEVNIIGSELSPQGLILHARTPVREYSGLKVDLHGLHQRVNAAIALRSCELAFEEVRNDPAPVYNGFRDVRRLSGLRGRLEVIQENPLIVADVAHNVEGLAAALAFLRPRLQGSTGRLHVLFATMRDKDVHLMATLLSDAGAVVTPVPLFGERARAADELSVILASYGIRVQATATVPEALVRFRATADPDDILLVTGSHQVVAQLES